MSTSSIHPLKPGGGVGWLQWGRWGVRHECSTVRTCCVLRSNPCPENLEGEKEGAESADQYRLGLYPWRTMSVSLERAHTSIHLRSYEGALECPTKERHGILTEQDTSLGRHHPRKRLSSAQSPGCGGGPTASLCRVLT